MNPATVELNNLFAVLYGAFETGRCKMFPLWPAIHSEDATVGDRTASHDRNQSCDHWHVVPRRFEEVYFSSNPVNNAHMAFFHANQCCHGKS